MNTQISVCYRITNKNKKRNKFTTHKKSLCIREVSIKYEYHFLLLPWWVMYDLREKVMSLLAVSQSSIFLKDMTDVILGIQWILIIVELSKCWKIPNFYSKMSELDQQKLYHLTNLMSTIVMWIVKQNFNLPQTQNNLPHHVMNNSE